MTRSENRAKLVDPPSRVTASSFSPPAPTSSPLTPLTEEAFTTGVCLSVSPSCLGEEQGQYLLRAVEVERSIAFLKSEGAEKEKG